MTVSKCYWNAECKVTFSQICLHDLSSISLYPFRPECFTSWKGLDGSGIWYFLKTNLKCNPKSLQSSCHVNFCFLKVGLFKVGLSKVFFIIILFFIFIFTVHQHHSCEGPPLNSLQFVHVFYMLEKNESSP